MRIRIYNARILTMKDNEDIFFGELWTNDDKIEYVGKEVSKEDLELVTFDRNIDAKGNLLMPGFKNAHTHSGMTAMRSYADGLPLAEWLETKIFPMEAIMTSEDVYELTRLAILEYLTSGITACFDMYLTPDSIAQSCEETGMRLVQVSGINKFGPSLEELEARYLRLNGKHPLSSFMLGFHAEYTCTRELLESISELSHKYKAPIYAHNSETEKEVKECYDRYGISPTQLFEEIGLFDYGGGGYHCVYFNDEDIRIFKERDLSVVTNPASNVKLASGIAPLTRYVEEGINVAIGTDGPSSNNCLDMFREMFLATGLQKIANKDASALKASDVLKMATVGGAKAMYLKDCDVLSKGKQADIIMIDLLTPNMQPINNIVDNLVYSGSKSNVKMTMIAGKILYENGDFFVGIDPMKIYDNAGKIMDRLKSSV